MKGEGLPSKENLSVQRPSEKVPRCLGKSEEAQGALEGRGGREKAGGESHT